MAFGQIMNVCVYFNRNKKPSYWEGDLYCCFEHVSNSEDLLDLNQLLKRKQIFMIDKGSEMFKGKKSIKVTCNVRNELNELRKQDDCNSVIYSMGKYGESHPVMPRVFPEGNWIIEEIRDKQISGKSSGIFGDWFISTSAFQTLPIWSLDDDRSYNQKTSKITNDYGYGLHASPNSITTWGCIRLPDVEMANILVEVIQRMRKNNFKTILSVGYKK